MAEDFRRLNTVKRTIFERTARFSHSKCIDCAFSPSSRPTVCSFSQTFAAGKQWTEFYFPFGWISKQHCGEGSAWQRCFTRTPSSSANIVSISRQISG
jgi:hypothetical protein